MAKKIDYASLFTLRKDGRYQGYYKGADGKRHVVCDRDPEKLYHKLLEKEAPPVTTFADIAEMWEGEHRQTITAKSWNNYAPHVENIVSIHGSKTMQQITAQDISNDLIRAKAQGYSATVVRTRRSIYRMIFDCAIAKGHAEFNPVLSVRMPKGLKTGKRTAPTEEEMKIIFSSLDQPFGLFPFFLLCTGLRKSEALALEWSDVDLYEKEISVTKSLEYLSNSNPRVKAPKTEAGNRIVPILDVLVEPLKDAKRRSKSPYLFPQGKSNRAKGGGIMSEHAYEGEWERYCKAVGFIGEDGKPSLTAHNLRHGTATLMFELGVDELTAQKILGHSRIEITREIYTDLRQKQQAKSVGKFNKGVARMMANSKK